MTLPAYLPSLALDRRRVLRLSAMGGVLALAVFVWGGYRLGWHWTGLTSNATLWAWLKLLALPLSLTALPLWLSGHRAMSRARRAVLTVGTVALAVLVAFGYALDWRWTGFTGNTLWDWLSVLLLPATIATVNYWTAERTIEARHRLLAAGVAAAFLAFAVCAYLLPIGWSGFVGNTAWDWVRLLFVPLLMPLVLAPTLTRWISAGVATPGDGDPADEPTTYEVWLTPDQKVTACLLTPAMDGEAPQLVVTGVDPGSVAG